MSDEHESLMRAAQAAREHAWAPYSGFRVGAAVLDEQGRLHSGCNVENAAYPQGICAEANAIGSMVAAGGRRIAALAVAGGVESLGPCTPCGGCRQVILEFADAATCIMMRDRSGKPVIRRIHELLPEAFALR